MKWKPIRGRKCHVKRTRTRNISLTSPFTCHYLVIFCTIYLAVVHSLYLIDKIIHQIQKNFNNIFNYLLLMKSSINPYWLTLILFSSFRRYFRGIYLFLSYSILSPRQSQIFFERVSIVPIERNTHRSRRIPWGTTWREMVRAICTRGEQRK